MLDHVIWTRCFDEENDVTAEKRSRAEWRRLREEWEASGLPRREFARRRGLNFRTFSWWCTQLRDEAESVPTRSGGFVEVVTARSVAKPTEPAAQEYAEAVPEERESVVVRLGDVIIDFGTRLPPAWWVVEVARKC
jgi:hypothetical protein